TFTYVTTAPTSTVVSPANNTFVQSLATISGTVGSKAGINAIQQVDVAIYVDTGAWFNEVNGQFDQPSEHYFTAQTSTSWAVWYTTGVAFVNGHSYNVASRALDKANNQESTFSVGVNSNTFTFETQGPTSQVTYPTVNAVRSSLPYITGTASDPISKVGALYLAINQIGTNKYFDGSTFITTTTIPKYFQAFANLNQQTTTWVYINASLAAALATDKRYNVLSQAYNAAGVAESPLNAPTTFYYDVTRPTSSITSPTATGFASSV